MSRWRSSARSREVRGARDGADGRAAHRVARAPSATFRAAHDAVAGGVLGILYSIRIIARDATPSPEHFIAGSGGMFRDMHVHDFDLARWISGREVATVYATGTVRNHERYARHGDVDTTAIVLTMDDGTPVTVDGSRHDPRGQDVRIEVVGSDDVVTAGLGDRTPLRALDPSGPTPSGPCWESAYERFAGAFAAETDAFVTLARDGGESPCPPETALEALRVAEACEAIARRGAADRPAVAVFEGSGARMSDAALGKA